MERKRRGEFFTGLLIIGMGILFLLRNVEILDFPFHKLWPLVFVVIGIGRLLSASTWENRSDSLFWFFLGATFFIGSNRLWGLSVHDTWPLILIGVGLSVVGKSLARHYENRKTEGDQP